MKSFSERFIPKRIIVIEMKLIFIIFKLKIENVIEMKNDEKNNFLWRKKILKKYFKKNENF